MSKWSELYTDQIKSGGGAVPYFRNKIAGYRKLIRCIKKYTPQGGTILEAGSGTGAISIYLSNLGYDVTAMDVDPDMLSLSASLAEEFPRKPIFLKGNIADLDPSHVFNTVFSSGTFEHFSDDEIVDLSNKELAVSRTLIISVPSNYYRIEDRMHGDERFLSERQWLELFSKTRGKVVRVIHYSFKNKREYLQYLLKIKPSPYIAFVLKNKNSPSYRT